jgi:tetratricopeptide (TPR) repeat protein
LNLGCALTQLDRCEEAVVDFRKALELDPELAEAHTQFGVTLTRLGRYDDAIAEFQEALRIRPDHPWTLKSWGEALRANGDIEPALARLEEAARIEGDNPCWGKSPDTLRSLAAVYADLRRFHEARETARTALDLAKQKDNASLAARLERDLALYRAGKPAGPIPDKR